VVCLPHILNNFIENTFSGGGSAYIAHADKEYAYLFVLIHGVPLFIAVMVRVDI